MSEAFECITSSFLLSSLGSVSYLPILEQVRRQLMSWQIENNNVIGGHDHYYGSLGNNGSFTVIVTMNIELGQPYQEDLPWKFRNSTKLLSQN